MRVAIDCATLGTGRGGDETYLRAILLGLAELVPGRWPRPVSPPDAIGGSDS